MTRSSACLLLLAATASGQQHAPVVRDLTVRADAAPARVEFALAWPNAWRNERNHDAAWIVLRGPDARRGPLALAAKGHAAEGKVAGRIDVAADRVGVFVAPASAHRGDASFRVTLVLDEPAPPDVTAWAVGMVYVPGGPFELGDDDALAVRWGAFHRVGENGAPAGPMLIAGEDELKVVKEAGALWYERDRDGYRGDQGGPIPAGWPKGTQPFYVMKREPTQGDYAAFLNALPAAWQERRAPLKLTGEEIDTCSIARADGRFVARAPDRPCNFVSWDDSCAWFDWLALRPLTEFEFEKAARGPRRPVKRDYPWGTASDKELLRKVQRTRDLAAATVADEAGFTDDDRARLGASHYWVMDLAGSVWERTISAGHATGRAFRGTHGDGVLSADGAATNDDWPRTDAGGELAPGIGFRGGAEYLAKESRDNPTNPHSPVAVRTYAGWGGAERYKTYSARAARRAPAP